MPSIPAWRRIAIVLCATIGSVGAQGGLGGGGPLGEVPPGHDCISAAERAIAEAQVMQYVQSHGLLEAGTGPFTFFPMAGQLAQDLWINNYVDLSSGAGILDWHCTDYTYEGHLGSDTDLRTFSEQTIGVPVFSAQDGTVTATQDGNPDMNTVAAGQPANYVIIDHGGGRLAYYWHLKNGSVAVSVGQAVYAGQQIGLTASSGNSTGPHLHFEVRENGTVVEPFAGSCRPGASLWLSQPPFNSAMYVRDFAISRTNPGVTSPPFPLPHDAQWVTTDPLIYFWVIAHNLPAGSTWRVRFNMPNGALAYDSGNVAFGIASFYRWSWWYWNWNITAMHNNVNAGTWTLTLDFNGANMITAPFEVVPAATPGFNRSPAPITASLSPAVPVPGDAMVCNVSGPLLLDDLDWEVVRYSYVWTVDGALVRSVTTAGRSDMLPHNLLSAGDVVSCTVTPSDATSSGPSASASAVLTGAFELSIYQDPALNAFIDVHNGPAGQAFVSFFSFDPLNAASPGTGWAAGLHIAASDVLAQYSLGAVGTAPYGGTLDGVGHWSVTYPASFAAAFSGLSVYGLSVHGLPAAPVVTAIASHTIQ